MLNIEYLIYCMLYSSSVTLGQAMYTKQNKLQIPKQKM
jgi:hypothetical protein